MDHAEDNLTYMREYFQSKGVAQKYSKGASMLSMEDEERAIRYVASGYVRIYSVNPRGEQYTHIIYGSGELFPLVWLVQIERHHVSYETLTDTEIYCVPMKDISDDTLTDNRLTLGLLKQSIEQYRIYSMRVDNLEYKYASERVAYQLILMANRFGIHDGAAVTIVPPLTHQLLGNSLNLSRESVSREMEKLNQKGLIRYNSDRQIIIPDVSELSKQMRVPLHQGTVADA